MDEPKFTAHARKRWEERFPGVDPVNAWFCAKRIGKGGFRQLRKQCPAHADEINKTGHSKYFLLYEKRIVFVVAVDTQEVVTVFPYGDRKNV